MTHLYFQRGFAQAKIIEFLCQICFSTAIDFWRQNSNILLHLIFRAKIPTFCVVNKRNVTL